MRFFKKILLTIGLSSLLVNTGWAEETSDPWEGFNRPVFVFNSVLDHYTLKPIAEGYQWVTPTFVQHGVTNMLNNLGEAKNFGNNVLQLKFNDAGVDLARFGFNSTFGLLGFFDVGSKMGLQRSDQDFGQTLGYWGVPTGPYVVLPFLGPSTVRDATGKVPDYFMSVDNYINDDGVQYAIWGVDIVDTRVQLLPLDKMIVGDPYIFIRNAYLENREYKIKGYVEDDF
nr:VacJ family lipoprotein [Entomomonas moraniae]